ncbi:MAG: DUF695 domain-containing protein [Bacteroidota bacterium]
MSLLKKGFRPWKRPIQSYEEFWRWFRGQEISFLATLKNRQHIERDLINKLSDKLSELRPGINFLAGMADEQVAEMIFTADGNIKDFVFVEELIAQAPSIPHWRFLAHKPALNNPDFSVNMYERSFNAENISFYYIEHPAYPDEIDVTFVYHSPDNEDINLVSNGILIFLDNYLGELNFATQIDTFDLVNKVDAKQDLIPLAKLRSFLDWREKEFIEKYQGTRYQTQEDTYSVLEGEIENGNPWLATVNADLLEWDGKASHPWMMQIEIKYEGDQHQGLPNEADFQLLAQIEDDISQELKDFEGHLNLAHITADGIRDIFFAHKDFRKPCRVLDSIKKKYREQMTINFEIYKDKYWQTLHHLMQGI